MNRRVVVTGLGVITSLSEQVEDLWQRVCNGESGIRNIKNFDASLYRVRFAGEVQGFVPEAYFSAKEAKRIDRFAQFALAASHMAVRHSGIDFAHVDPFRAGSILGSGIGGLNEFEVQHARLLTKGPDKVSAFTIPKIILNAAPGHVAIQFNLRGPSSAIATACASAANAIGDAMRAIRYDDADVMVTGGSEAAVTPMGISGFSNMRALSERNDEPTRASRPFDRGRDGFVLSEGSAVLVLEELEHARRRGANILAELLGFGSSTDAGHMTQPDERGEGAAKAMTRSLKDAGLSADSVDYINAHGTSTPLGDKAETNAIKSVFGTHAREVSISSTKSQLGHLLGASGAVELVLSILAMRDGIVPPTINLEDPDPDCDLDYTANVARRRKLQVAMSNSFGFGGHNASLVVGLLRKLGDRNGSH